MFLCFFFMISQLCLKITFYSFCTVLDDVCSCNSVTKEYESGATIDRVLILNRPEYENPGQSQGEFPEAACHNSPLKTRSNYGLVLERCN